MFKFCFFPKTYKYVNEKNKKRIVYNYDHFKLYCKNFGLIESNFDNVFAHNALFKTITFQFIIPIFLILSVFMININLYTNYIFVLIIYSLSIVYIIIELMIKLDETINYDNDYDFPDDEFNIIKSKKLKTELILRRKQNILIQWILYMIGTYIYPPIFKFDKKLKDIIETDEDIMSIKEKSNNEEIKDTVVVNYE